MDLRPAIYCSVDRPSLWKPSRTGYRDRSFNRDDGDLLGLVYSGSGAAVQAAVRSYMTAELEVYHDYCDNFDGVAYTTPIAKA